MNPVGSLTPAIRRRPEYDNRHVRNFRAWYVANEPRLADHFNELTSRAATIVNRDYFEFVAAEHEREEARSLSDLVQAARAAHIAALTAPLAPPSFWQFLRDLCFGARRSRDPNKYERRDWPAEDCQ